MLNAKQVLIVVVVGLFIAGISMEANAAGTSQVDYHVTCGTLAIGMGDETKARYYAELIPSTVTDEHLKRVIVSTVQNIGKYAEQQGVSMAEVSGYAFKNYGCDRPFI